jgi:tripartite-type tricarboxylate transporter receptor subunit TctC
MKLPHRRQFLHLAASAAALPAVSRIARAQTYPTRPVRIVVGFPPGGGVDITARLIGQWLSERLGQPFIIDNRPGAGSNIATEAVVRATPDGYSLLLVGSYNAINATLYDRLNFNFIRDIAPVATIYNVPNVMAVHPSFPAKTILEFIAYSKSNPGKVNMGSGTPGAAMHMSGELFKIMASIDMVHARKLRKGFFQLIDAAKFEGHKRDCCLGSRSLRLAPLRHVQRVRHIDQRGEARRAR